jgi:hypothetical protein
MDVCYLYGWALGLIGAEWQVVMDGKMRLTDVCLVYADGYVWGVVKDSSYKVQAMAEHHHF